MRPSARFKFRNSIEIAPGQPNAGAGLDFFAEQLSAYFGHASSPAASAVQAAQLADGTAYPHRPR